MGGLVVIGQSPATLTIGPIQGSKDQWHGLPIDVVLNLPSLRAARRILVVPDGLTSFWADLAADWKGWSGARIWDTDFGRLKLACVHDGVGLVWVEVQMEPSPHDKRDWSLTASLSVEAGSLDQTASALSALLGSE